MMTSYLGSLAYKSWKLTKIMPNSLKLLNHYILSNAPQKIYVSGPLRWVPQRNNRVVLILSNLYCWTENYLSLVNKRWTLPLNTRFKKTTRPCVSHLLSVYVQQSHITCLVNEHYDPYIAGRDLDSGTLFKYESFKRGDALSFQKKIICGL